MCELDVWMLLEVRVRTNLLWLIIVIVLPRERPFIIKFIRDLAGMTWSYDISFNKQKKNSPPILLTA